jgi:hypothetical protein
MMQKSRESVRANRGTASGGCRKRLYKLGLSHLERYGDDDNDPDPQAFIDYYNAPVEAHRFKGYWPCGQPWRGLKRQANKEIRRCYDQELGRICKLSAGALESQAEMIDEEFDPHQKMRVERIKYVNKFT